MSVEIALQHIEGRDFGALIAVLDVWFWSPDAKLLEPRAISAVLARPPVLRSPERARSCLAVVDRIIADFAAVETALRRGEPFAVLQDGLSYAPDNFVAARPEEGCPVLAH